MKIALCDDKKLWIGELCSLLREYHIARHIDYYVEFFSGSTEILKKLE